MKRRDFVEAVARHRRATRRFLYFFLGLVLFLWLSLRIDHAWIETHTGVAAGRLLVLGPVLLTVAILLVGFIAARRSPDLKHISCPICRGALLAEKLTAATETGVCPHCRKKFLDD
jgi:hypothetical protein